MKKNNILSHFLILAISTLLISCENDFLPGIAGDGERLETLVILDDFESIRNTTEADIFIQAGDEQRVMVYAQQNILDNLVLDVRGKTWTIKHDKRVRQLKHVSIFITIPELDQIEISGSGDLYTENEFDKLRSLKIELSGSGEISFEGDIRELDVKISGSGSCEMAGEAESLNFKGSGSGDFFGYDLKLESAEMNLSGSGDAKVEVADLLDVDISGSGSVYYRGSPEIISHISGSGRLIDDN